MSSLSEQLLKAGLVTKEQVKKAEQKPKPKAKKSHNKANRKSIKKTPKEQSDLEQFYNARSKQESKEKQKAERKKKELARIKKETNDKINALIAKNLLNDADAEIRYNFVVGTTIKYIFVTEQQQKKLSDGEIGITFLGGKRCLIPKETALEIKQLNPHKIVILAE